MSEQAQRERSLFIEVMLLMITADGEVRDREMAQLAHTVAEHPIFQGTDEDAVAQAFADAFSALTRDGFEARLSAISDGLSDYASRLFAFALAGSICFADGEVAANELRLLKRFQVAFGLHDEHVAEVFAAVHGEDDLSELLHRLRLEHEGLTSAMAHIEVMLLMAAADGEIADSEAAHLALTIAHQEGLKTLTEEEIGNAVLHALLRMRSDGIATRLSVLRRVLPAENDRVLAVTNAYAMLVADGVVEHGETECLERMRNAFDLSDEAMRRAIAHATG